MNPQKIFYNFWYRFFPPEMVHYWKEKETALARTRIAKEGHFEMEIKGEKHPLKGFPRGHLLQTKVGDYPLFSKIKHEVKNRIFNWAWSEIEKGTENKVIVSGIKKEALPKILELFSGLKYFMVPYDRLVPAVKELYRAMAHIEKESTLVLLLKNLLSFILHEDDSYRYRVQWLFEAANFKKGDSIEKIRRKLDVGLKKMEDAEVIEDMKGKIRLLRRVLLQILSDERIGNLAEKLFREINPRKMWLDRADKYHFRGKYFKVDHAIYDY